MNPAARIAQLFTRWITIGLYAIAGALAGGPLSSETQTTLSDFSAAISIALAGLVTFLLDLWLHRLQKEKNS